jgi:O-6-methylguanine DNA methyltransferase
MSYWTLPEEILENKNELQMWIEKSLEVPLKPVKKKTKKQKELPKKVLESLLKIPKGKVTTYKNLAQKFDTHPRAIAQIMRGNKHPIDYPCYKVIASSGKISGYNTKRGVEEKIEKLEADGIKIID